MTTTVTATAVDRATLGPALTGAPLGTIVFLTHQARPVAVCTATAYLRTFHGWEGRFAPAIATTTLVALAADARRVTILPPAASEGVEFGTTTENGHLVYPWYETAVWSALNRNTTLPAPAHRSQVVRRLPGGAWEPVQDPRLTDDLTTTPGPAPERPSIQERFETFHATNPWVYDRLANMALTRLEQGRTRISIGMLWEVLRDNLATMNPANDGPLLDNSLRSRYARALIDNHPQLDGVITVRGLRS